MQRLILQALVIACIAVSSAHAFLCPLQLRSPSTKGAESVRPSRTLAPVALQMILDPSAILVDPNYNLAAGAAVVGTLCGVLEDRLKVVSGAAGKVFGAGAIVFTLFGAFVAFQTTTLRFQFDESSFSLVKADGAKLSENVVVGGENAWKYTSFVNYDFLPSRDFPILVYFKETQTPEENWVEAPIVVDSLKGQAHFFPAIANTQQLEEGFLKRGCTKADKGEGSVEGVSLKATGKAVF